MSVGASNSKIMRLSNVTPGPPTNKQPAGEIVWLHCGRGLFYKPSSLRLHKLQRLKDLLLGNDSINAPQPDGNNFPDPPVGTE